MTEARRLKEKAALASIAVSSLMSLAKLLAGFLSGSLAVLSEAANNLVDVATTIITYFAITVAHKPADEQHQFGHGKVEALAALVETGFLFAMAAYILVEAVKRLFWHEAEIAAGPVVIGILVVSMGVDFIRWRSLRRIARETRSDALAADALHFSSDIVSTGLALLGLLAAHYGFPQGDAIAALGVACFIAVAGYGIGRRTVDTLLDAAPKGLTAEITGIARQVPGVIEVETLRLRPAGGEVLGDLAIKVARTLPLEKVAAITANTASAIKTVFPEVEVTVTTVPTALDDETILEQILLAAARRHLQVHHVTIQDIAGRISVSFDIELDGRMPYADAHEIVSGLESEIRQELGDEIEVETHIEPLEPHQVPGEDADPSIRDEIAGALAREIPRDGAIRDVHEVRVRKTPAGLVVNYHCAVDPALGVDAVHEEVDALERKIRDEFTAIVRIVGHAEPLRT